MRSQLRPNLVKPGVVRYIRWMPIGLNLFKFSYLFIRVHSFYYFRRPSGMQWRPLWDSMAQECREEITLVEADTLLDTLEAYLQKHR